MIRGCEKVADGEGHERHVHDDRDTDGSECPGYPPEHVQPTAEQMLARLNALGDDESIEVMMRLMESADEARRCFIENHIKIVEMFARTSGMLFEFSNYIDASYADGTPQEVVLRRRIDKIVEETGEVYEALGGAVGENPRKGVTHDMTDVRKELLDVAVAALGAAVHLSGGLDVHGALHDHVRHVWRRAGLGDQYMTLEEREQAAEQRVSEAAEAGAKAQGVHAERVREAREHLVAVRREMEERT